MFTISMLLFSTTNSFQQESEFEEMDIKEMNKYLSKFYLSLHENKINVYFGCLI